MGFIDALWKYLLVFCSLPLDLACNASGAIHAVYYRRERLKNGWAK
jgi:hypothetical protein